MSKRSSSISVRELVEFVLRTGDLGPDRDFVGPNRALEGTRGHQRLQRSRPAEYRPEVPLSFQVETPELVLIINGRVDGILHDPSYVLLEEIKTVRAGWNFQPDPLHWAQAKIYASIYSRMVCLERIDIQLTYLDLDTETVIPHRQTFTARDLTSFSQEVISLYLSWLTDQVAWWNLRDASIQSMEFPFPRFRAGQRELIDAAGRVFESGKNLFSEAPTGIGKTISVLFPAVKSIGQGRLEKVFYLTAKTVGRTAAEKAIADMRQAGLRLRAITFTAREKLCFNEGRPCDLKTCPYASGYYDRLRDAMRNALQLETLDRTTIERVAHQHQVCPSALCHDLSRWVDAIICDYNYVFDPKVYLRNFFDQERGNYAFLVDEAHNLVDRAREMFSADLHEAEFLDVHRAVGRALPRCAKLLRAAAKQLGTAVQEDAAREDSPGDLAWAKKGAPRDLVPALRAVLTESELWLAKNQPSDFREGLLSLYFRITDFLRTLDRYDERYVTLGWTYQGRTVLRLFCLDPSTQLQSAIQRGGSTVFFSATMSPLDYFHDIFGKDEADVVVQLPSPFARENLRVLVAGHIATDYKRRGSTCDEVAHAIAALVRGKMGNYMAYFPSYQYLNQVLTQFQRLHPDLDTLVQSPGMTEEAREAFLRAFRSDHDRTLVGFAVMGGIFGEGIDLVGDRLVGAVIVGVGLPQLCLERDLIRDYFEARNSSGFEYAYTYPGITRVFQAVGRVIRSETDRGIVLLIDTRFFQSRYQSLLPSRWEPRRVGNPEEISQAAREFWEYTIES